MKIREKRVFRMTRRGQTGKVKSVVQIRRARKAITTRALKAIANIYIWELDRDWLLLERLLLIRTHSIDLVRRWHDYDQLRYDLIA